MENVLKPSENQVPNFSYLDSLNPQQRQAVETTEGALLVLSGAGTGKTRVLTSRIAHILHCRKAWPGEILAVTFTNKAAREMADRVNMMLANDVNNGFSGAGSANMPFLGTFHSIGAKILRRHGDVLGFSSDFVILDSDDQLRLLKTILTECEIDVQRKTPKQYLHVISNWKDRGLPPDKLSAVDIESSGVESAEVIYRMYQQRLLDMNAMDFGDLLLHNLTLFTQHADILQNYSSRFRYILVDEYQDTNIAQYLWLRLLAMVHKNICCVGDDDQSIYGWRGAEIGNILKFEKDFPDAKIIRLEQNYRSTPQILAAASQLISHNRNRLGKKLWTEADNGDPIYLQTAIDSEEEAYIVASNIEEQHKDHVPYKEMAVLVRAGFQTRQFEERFLTLGLPYKVVGGVRFYERQEIKDIISYLRVVNNQHDNLALERIINVPKRGVGKASLEKIHSYARKKQISLFMAAKKLVSDGGIRGKLAASIDNLLQQFDSWQGMLAKHTISEIADIIIDESGYRAMLEKQKDAQANGRLENLRELVRAMGEFETLTDFLEHVGLVIQVTEQDGAAAGDMISLMTLHAAKGLEFEVVFLPGWEEGLFPHQKSLDEAEYYGLEEERRLAYVGITRARKRVFITHAQRRRFFTKHGIEWQNTIPSRFISELPSQHVEVQDNYSLQQYRKYNSDSYRDAIGASLVDDDFTAELAAIMRDQGKVFTANIAKGKQTAGNTSCTLNKREEFAPGSTVYHAKFGRGIVIKKRGDKLDIAFSGGVTKSIMADFVQSDSNIRS